MQNFIGNLTRDSVDRGRLACLEGLLASFGSNIPYNTVDLVVLELVKYSVASDQNVVEVARPIDFVGDLRLAAHNASHTTQILDLGFTVAECPAHGKTTWEDTVGADKRVLVIV